ncbi:hypothetical protein PV08_06399 [Exophiala spinifera]|uniref:Aminoglycoside phosphotransferase domain-containing protein n=1 Tax=Exophiala spinifera TaxID=91928 RepID=A0A0D2BBG2_9EURO|nr:uncharacterized protein PV08_06399 [Exophiala spinifera]KIW16348.1 hypothetical protein PV08_06399 [Exophiala spinifera]
MWNPPPLPYFCDSSLVPASLPSTADIENATSVLKDGSSRVLRVGDHFVVKYGPQIRRRIQEGLNTIFVNQNLTTPSPLVYALYEEKGNAYLVMQYVAGQSLEQLWPGLQDRERRLILRKLRTVLDDMRSLTPPSPLFYGSVDRGPLPYFLFWTPKPQEMINGPFDTEEQLYLGLVEQLRQIYSDNNQHMSRVEWLRKHLPVSLKGHPPTFTHGDIQKKNILVDKIGKGQDDFRNEDDFSLTIVDWEDAGWYPSYFEYFISYTSFLWDDDWPQLLEICLDAFPLQIAMLSPIYHGIFL